MRLAFIGWSQTPRGMNGKHIQKWAKVISNRASRDLGRVNQSQEMSERFAQGRIQWSGGSETAG
jgi:hypothetical protein